MSLTRIARLVHKLQYIDVFRPSHEVWPPLYSPANWRAFHLITKLHWTQLWKLQYPADNLSLVPPGVLANLRGNQGLVIPH